MNTLTAAVCLEQLKKVRKICSKRHALGKKLDSLLGKIHGITPRPAGGGNYATYWYYVFTIDTSIIKTSPENFRKACTAEGAGLGTMRGVLDWPLFQDPPDDRHACSFHCPHYAGNVGYDLADYPGYRKHLETACKTGFSEYHKASDMELIYKAVAKVAAHYS